VPEPPPLAVWRSTQTGGARKPLPAAVSRPGAWPRSNGADPKTKPVKSPVAGGPRQDTVPFLSCLEEQKLRFSGPGTLRCAPCSCPPGRQKLAGPVPPGQRASASPSAPESFQPPKYLGVPPSPRERLGSTKAGRRLERRPLPGRAGTPWSPVRQGVGIIAGWLAGM
jgi:hypothetical protein